ncbi:MAG TPA: hypothetical protein VGR51_00325 [Thermoplasmata archaeon]|jgi:hypothetical protein|nr:hypothetical protein [Thermoplasmata archaeon]
MADDEDAEEQGGHGFLSAAKLHVPIWIAIFGMWLVAWWNPWEIGPFVLWAIGPVVFLIAEPVIVMYQVLHGSKKVGLGDTDEFTINQKASVGKIAAEYDEDGVLAHGPMQELRVGGKSYVFSTQGRHWAIFPDGDDVIEDTPRYMKIHADFGGTWYEWTELPPNIRERFVKVVDWGKGKPGDPNYRKMTVEAVKPGYVISGNRRSHVYIAWRKTPRNTPADAGSTSMHAVVKDLSNKILDLEAQLRQSGFVAPAAAGMPQPPYTPPGGSSLVGP